MNFLEKHEYSQNDHSGFLVPNRHSILHVPVTETIVNCVETIENLSQSRQNTPYFAKQKFLLSKSKKKLKNCHSDAIADFGNLSKFAFKAISGYLRVVYCHTETIVGNNLLNKLLCVWLLCQHVQEATASSTSHRHAVHMGFQL
jgi:hypothetical protein